MSYGRPDFGWGLPPGVTDADIERSAGVVSTVDSVAFGKFCDMVAEETDRAQDEHDELASAHEGLAVIWKQFEQLKTQVFMKPHEGSNQAMIKECVQIAAMSFCFVLEVCDINAKGVGRTEDGGC